MADQVVGRSDYSRLSGSEKAAIFMLVLGEEHAGAIFPLLNDDEVRSLASGMARLNVVEGAVVERVCSEFAEAVTQSAGAMGGYDATERLLKQFFDPDKVDNIMDEIRGPMGRNIWEKLGNVNEAVLARFLQNEYPQTAATVLSRISAQHAARVIDKLPAEFGLDIMQRMLRIDTVNREVLNNVEEALREEFMSRSSRTNRHHVFDHMAKIINSVEKNNREYFLQQLTETDYDDTMQVKSLMFTFDDFVRLDPSALQLIISRVDVMNLAIALKGANENIRELFFGNMSGRAAENLQAEIAELGGMKVSVVEQAQAEIINMTRDLAEAGEINIPEPGQKEDIVY
ncbi:MAG: flagellar motor switch protein FliG [Pseudomonadota bacterium]